MDNTQFNLQKILVCILLICISVFSLYAQVKKQNDEEREISGDVLLPDNSPAVGAVVMVKNTTKGVTVFDDGKFSLKVSPNDVIQVAMIGYDPFETNVGFKDYFKIILKEEAIALDDVIVVAYGSQKKMTITGAINSVGSDEILRSPTANITNAIAGTLPGLTSVQRSGEPGKDGAVLKVRGIGTLNDGQESAPLILIDGVERSSIDLLDPNEVESINILKDASATAVYGVRGANGVIIVTTKAGGVGKPKISVSSNFGWQTYTVMPELANAYEWATLYNEGIDNEGSSKAKYPEEAMNAWLNNSDPVIYPSVNWMDMMFKKFAPQQTYNFNVSGGTERVKYFISLGMLHQKGIYKEQDIEGVDFSINPDYTRYNIRANIDADLTKRLSLSLRMGIVYTQGNYSNIATSKLFQYALSSTPFGPGIVDGKLISIYSGNDPLMGYNRLVSNPISAIVKEGYNDNVTSTYNLSADFKYDFGFLLPGLKARAKVAYDDYGMHTVKYTTSSIPLYSLIVDDKHQQGYYLARLADDDSYVASETFNSRYRNVYLEAGLEYNAEFGKHNVSALLLYNQRVQNNPSFAYHLPKALLGLVGRVTYNYNNRYLAEINLGYNGSENFAEGQRFGFFPAFSLGWIFTEEPFFPKNNIFTYGKIRGSYGEVGNDQIGGQRYLYLPPTYVYGSGGYNFGIYGDNRQYYPASAEGSTGNPNVTWERARKSNIGIDMKLFDSRLGVTFDYFYEKRDKILWNYGTVPSIVGTTLSAANIGKVNNRGCEVEVGWSSGTSDFQYWLSGIFSYAKNEIIYMDEPQRAYDYLNKTGFSVGAYKGYVNEGFINTVEDLENQPAHSWGTGMWDRGELNFVDVNGDGIVDTNDMVPVGYGQYPEITFGLNLGFRYKGFEFSALFQGAANVTLYMKESAMYPLFGGKSAQKWHMGRWTEERYMNGEEITCPRVLTDAMLSPSIIGNNPLSTFWLKNASYVRLKNIEIAYQFKNKKLNDIGISAIRLYVNGSNLLTFSGLKQFDPESPSGLGNFYPIPKVYNAGFKIVF